MPANKNASLRYRIIDEVLQVKIPLDFDVFMDRVNTLLIDSGVLKVGEEMSLRQIQYDISEMKKERPVGFSAPIVRKKGKIFYSDTSYFLIGTELSENQMRDLANLFSLYEKYWSFPQTPEVKSFIKAYSNFEANEIDMKELVEFNVNNETQGVKKLSEMISLVMKKKQAIIKYQPFQREIISYVVDPLYLKEYNNRWFLLTFDVENKRYTTLGLERIIDFKILPNTIDPSRRNSFKSSLRYVIGVSVPNFNPEPVQVRFRITNFYKDYLFTKPLHFSQKIQKEGDDWVAQFLLIPNKELIAEILRWGSNITVLEPEILKIELTQEVRKMYLNYIPS